MRKILISGELLIAAIVWLIAPPAQAISLSSGKILLAVEGHGEAWYINPPDQKRYYLGRPYDAFQVMRGLAIGISNADFALLEKNQLAQSKVLRLLGRILIKPQDNGRAYYFEPEQKQLYYLGRPYDAFQIMKETALGATNKYISLIPIGSISVSPAINTMTKIWNWRWNNHEYNIQLNLSTLIYDYYRQQSKAFAYVGSLPDNWREQYYGQFLTGASQENTIRQISEQLQQQAQDNGLNTDQMAELTAAFIQSIPYDQVRSEIIKNNASQITPNYPYETLYLNKGVCTDKTLLAWLIFRKLGYGVVIMSYPEANHMALGLACPPTAANYPAGYCFVETTQFYHIGLMPNIANGQIATTSATPQNWQPSGNLTEPSLYRVATGRTYNSLNSLKETINAMIQQKTIADQLQNEIETNQISIDSQLAELQRQQQQLDALRAANNIDEYNQLVPIYNQLVQTYEQNSQQYNQKINQLNKSIREYNRLLAEIQPSQNAE
jgi:hypothetical protein